MSQGRRGGPSSQRGETESRRGADWESRSELRADWLKLRGYLYDPVTRLPSLPMVLDEIRRRLEEGELLRLIYLDLSSHGNAEAVGGWQVHDRWMRLAAAALEAWRGDLFGMSDVITQNGVRSDEFLIITDAGRDPDDQLAGRLLRRLVREQSQDVELADLPAPQAAAVPLEPLPRRRLERSIYSAIGHGRDRCRREIERQHAERLEELRRLLRSEDLVVRYQPIFDLRRHRVFGFEALSAAPDSAVFENPERLFSFAEEHADVVGLERVCRRQAIARFPDATDRAAAPLGAHLFLNCSPRSFQDPHLAEDLLSSGLAESAVLEVTERVSVTEWRSFRRTVENLRRAGLRVALDDVGAGYSSLQAIGEIEPDFLKFDFSLIHGLHESPIKRELVTTLASLADKIGARAIAEGIEHPEELDAVCDLGVELGQGFLFGRPAEPQNIQPASFPAGA